MRDLSLKKKKKSQPVRPSCVIQTASLIGVKAMSNHGGPAKRVFLFLLEQVKDAHSKEVSVEQRESNPTTGL